MRRTPILRIVVLLAAEITALAGAIRSPGPRVDWHSLQAWLDQVPPDDAIIAVVRLAAIGVASWLAITTVLYTAASLTRIPGAIKSIRWATIAPIRRLLDTALAVTIVTATLTTTTGRAHARPAAMTELVDQQQAPVYTPIAAGDHPSSNGSHYTPIAAGDGSTSSTRYTPTAAGDSTPGVLGYTPTPAGDPTVSPGPPPSAAEAPVGEYTVVRGDNLWTIAQHHLETTLGRTVTNDETRHYWQALITENHTRLRSNNPDLVHPGETLTLPGLFAATPGRDG